MASSLTDDDALALLANTIATAAALVVLISVFAPISGAHFNPVVSAVMALRGELSARELAVYVGAQMAGGIAGTWVSHLMFEHRLFEVSQKARLGGGQWISEGVAAFGLVLVILVGLRFTRSSLPWLVGLYITAAYWFTASTSFANPAVVVARIFTDTFAGIRPVDAPAFIAAEFAGALLASGFCSWLLKEEAGSQS